MEMEAVSFHQSISGFTDVDPSFIDLISEMHVMRLTSLRRLNNSIWNLFQNL